MDPVYMHLLVNHFPIVISFLGLAGVIAAMITRRPFFWLFGMTCLVLAALGGIVAFLTGDQAGDAVEHVWYITRQAVNAHEEAGEIALWVTIIVGIIGAYGLWRFNRPVREDYDPFPYWLRALVGVAAVAASASVAYAGYEGGKIVHEASVLRTAPPGFVPPPAPAPR